MRLAGGAVSLRLIAGICHPIFDASETDHESCEVRLIDHAHAASLRLYSTCTVYMSFDIFRERAGRLELELFSMLCSHDNFTDQSYHAWIRSGKNSSIRSDACMTADYARGQPASAWPLAGQPCRVDSDLHTIARCLLYTSPSPRD